MSTTKSPEGATLPNTTDQSLWRAATVVAGEQGALDPLGEAAFAEGATRYELSELLGVGGMGEVRLCRDAAIGRDVAHKTLRQPDAGPGARRRFLREVRVQGQLEHPSIVPVYDLGTDADGALFFTMRRVRGQTLTDVLAAAARGDAAPGSYSRRKLLDAFVRVCLAVDYANTRGVLHRDLKPANIMLGDFGEVYLLDWGVAKLVAEPGQGAKVKVPEAVSLGQGTTVGTAGYMSPEQLLGLGDVQDARTDVYALGCILFELLTLRRLHEGNSFESLSQSTLSGPSVSARSVAPDAPPELDAVCAKATCREPDGRYASARELADAVERYLDGDRDAERRRELSVERVAAARAALARGADGDEAKARADAAREVTAALALDPDNAEAREILMRLFVEAPARMPAEVEAEIARRDARERAHFVRYGIIGLFTWLACAPLVVAMGVRRWEPVLATTALVAAGLAYSAWARRAAQVTAAHVTVIAALVLATSASACCWLGPFVLVPQFAASITVWIAASARRRRDRYAVLALGVAATAAPFIVEGLGLFPPAYTITRDAVTLHARAVSFHAVATLAMLFYASVSSTLLPGAFLGGVRESLDAAERRLFLQAWHLRKLVGEPDALVTSPAGHPASRSGGLP